MQIDASARRDFYRYGWLFAFAALLCRAVDSGSFGPYAHTFGKEDVALLVDFHTKPRETVEVYNRAGITWVRGDPSTISEFIDMEGHRNMVTRSIYGLRNGTERRSAADCSADL